MSGLRTTASGCQRSKHDHVGCISVQTPELNVWILQTCMLESVRIVQDLQERGGICRSDGEDPGRRLKRVAMQIKIQLGTMSD